MTKAEKAQAIADEVLRQEELIEEQKRVEELKNKGIVKPVNSLAEASEEAQQEVLKKAFEADVTRPTTQAVFAARRQALESGSQAVLNEATQAWITRCKAEVLERAKVVKGLPSREQLKLYILAKFIERLEDPDIDIKELIAAHEAVDSFYEEDNTGDPDLLKTLMEQIQ